MLSQTTTRRGFLALLPATAAALAAFRPGPHALRSGAARRWSRGHPEPRPGIDASGVVPADALPSRAVEVFDQVREIPEIVDGIRCRCGCQAVENDMYSLLSCFEAPGMARYCRGCQKQGRLVYRLHAEGRTLDEIRDAIDAEFG